MLAVKVIQLYYTIISSCWFTLFHFFGVAFLQLTKSLGQKLNYLRHMETFLLISFLFRYFFLFESAVVFCCCPRL